MTQKYISVDKSDNTSSAQVKLQNKNNEFCGTLKSTPQGGNGEPVDVRDLFIGGIKIDNVPQEAETNSDGVKEISITLPRSGVKAFKTTWDDSIPQGRWDIYTFDGELITQSTLESEKPRKGDIIIVEKPLSSTKSDFFCGIFTTDNWGWKYLNAEGIIKSIVLKGSESGEIPAKVDENGNAVIELEELEFDELIANSLYLNGKNIFDYIPDLSSAKDIGRIDTTNGTTVNAIAEKLNQLIGILKGIAETQDYQQA